MRKNQISIGLLAFLFSSPLLQASPEKRELNTNWQFSKANQENWQKATVPGSIHQDLLTLKQLPDPFYGNNQEKVQWVEDNDWEYRTSFNLSATDLEKQGASLHFGGLDTYADVYLNGSLILQSQNMFVGHRVNVKEVLREGENNLYIYFHSPIKKTLAQCRSNSFDYPADNDRHDVHTSVFTRKAPYHYGWDWGVRMVGVGVWRPIDLNLYDALEITDWEIDQTLSSNHATLAHSFTTDAVVKKTTPATLRLSCSLDGSPVSQTTHQFTLQPGENSIHFETPIENPQLWMPHGWGEPHLYDLKTEVLVDGHIVAQKKERVGLRSVKVLQRPDQKGESFELEVNGQPIFIKGANYIPNDIILTNVKKKDYDKLFENITEANMNMIRVWGGGIYEEDYFYDLADENGILIWQDFMFACTSYPADPAFLENVAQEAEYNIKRLRNHASIAMWCGNNEVLEGIKYWGWQKRFEPNHYQSMAKGYDKLFREALAKHVNRHDPERFYIHGSPDTANWGRPNSLAYGDSHYWGVWYGQQPFEILDERVPRMMSEFGFQAFPEMKVIETFAHRDSFFLSSEHMKAHQKSSTGNETIRTYMKMYYHVPEEFDDFVYVGLVMQGQGMRRGFEAHRRNRPYCMGTLYWQLNDSWPAISWSSIDYFGNWKALHYQAKRAFKPVAIHAFEEDDMLQFHILSDQLQGEKGASIAYELIDFNGKSRKKGNFKADIPANQSVCVQKIALDDLVTESQRANCFLKIKLQDKNGSMEDEIVYYFEKPKDLDLPMANVSYKVKKRDGEYLITLKCKQLAKDLFIEIPVQGAKFSDNFFDLLPGEEKTVTIRSEELQKHTQIPITIKHLRQTYP